MKSTVFSAVMAVALSVAVVLTFATASAWADSMQQKDNAGSSVGVTTEPHQDVFFGGEAGATAERDRRFSAPRHVTGERSDAIAGVVMEPHQDVFFGGEAGATAERDRRFSDASKFMLRFTGPGETRTPVPQPGAFYNGEHGAGAERDRRAATVTRAEQRGLILPEEAPRIIISGEPSVEWYEPWAGTAGSGSSWGQPARAGSMVSRRQRAVAPVYIYEVDPYPYAYWFAPISGQE